MFDVVHGQVLDRILEARGVGKDTWNDAVRADLVQAWYNQRSTRQLLFLSYIGQPGQR